MGGAAWADIGFYDWFLSAAPVAAVMPIVFALAIAISVAQLLRYDDHRLWGGISAAALCAIIVLACTAIRPSCGIP